MSSDAPAQRVEPHARAEATETSFPVAGETIAATWYQPEARHGPLPCLVMGHGFTLTRRDGIPEYARRLAAAGFAVLAFDYRHWGDSTGQPRRCLSLRKQLIDWHTAVEYARSMASIDADRVVVWGMSMGGGHALLTAARDSRIAAVVALVPVTDPLAVRRPPAIGMRMFRRALREILTRRPVRMPVAGPPGSFALVAAPEALSGFERLTAGHDWHNDVNTGWLLAAARWRPVREATKIRAPILLQLAEHDGAVPLAAIERTAARAPRAELKRYDLDHFSCFWGENITQLATDQIQFLRRHLLSPGNEPNKP
jgi:dienelactone hydrolase